MAASAREESPLVTWGPRESKLHDVEPFVTPHRLADSGLFTDDALAALIDRYPRERLQVFTMGTDPSNNSDWGPVDTTDVSGRDMLKAAAVGRFWIKLMRLDIVDRDSYELVKHAFAGIWAQTPGLIPGRARPLLLISSPGALVYYHADAYPTMLYHLRGSKRVWIYPPAKPELIDPLLMEQIYAGEIDEEVPYRQEYDRQARVFDLQPDELLTWPLNAPHRIVNHDSVNVSVSVQYGTQRGDRRALVNHANNYFRKRLGLRMQPTDEGLGAAIKTTTFRIARKLSPASATAKKRQYMAKFRVDGNAAKGMTLLPGGPVKTPF